MNKKEKEIADALQVCFNAGTKKILLLMSNAADIATVPSELFAKFQTSFIYLLKMLQSRH